MNLFPWMPMAASVIAPDVGSETGLVNVASDHSVPETIDRLESLAKSKKALAWQDAGGSVWLSYNSPDYLKRRHGVPETLLPNIAGIKLLVEQAAR